MVQLTGPSVRIRDDVARYEREVPLEERLPGRSVLDVFTRPAVEQALAASLFDARVEVR